MTVVKVPVKSNTGFIYAIGPDSGLILKKDLLSKDPIERGKGKLNDAKYKHFQVDYMYLSSFFSFHNHYFLFQGHV